MIVRWRARDHYKAIASWYHARGLEAPSLERIPEVGFVVDDRVAGWIYRTDSTVALIDGVISNPHTLPSARKLSLQKLAGVLVDTALALGYPDVIATSSHPSIQKLCPVLGLRETGQRVYQLTESLEVGGSDEPEEDQ